MGALGVSTLFPYGQGSLGAYEVLHDSPSIASPAVWMSYRIHGSRSRHRPCPQTRRRTVDHTLGSPRKQRAMIIFPLDSAQLAPAASATAEFDTSAVPAGVDSTDVELGNTPEVRTPDPTAGDSPAQ